ncbi:histone-binding protein RBBP7 [Trypanosoma rangeli]|uniref:Histone-binding protein RBBP7 n=1 Tax=Trypanosoma rangeli TaxID=5698 RepID=A0A422P4U3_TRYRA|nr:histone-binding protein RBBP7 [Trypanosoma rangeli]RNF12752.1 histone-binding protein RBBP7 [Trypanosoma rangeli]|eukprot:RNF12752.1 histone-binding protein RBBP7 [Trypanosoma rangeli]
MSTQSLLKEFVRLVRFQRTWGQNLRKLYFYCSTHVLGWPSLTVDWISGRRTETNGWNCTLQYLAVGTQAFCGRQNYVRAIGVAVANEPDEVGAEEYSSTGNSVSRGVVQEVGANSETRVRSVCGHCAVEETIHVDGVVLKTRSMPQNSDIIAVQTASGCVGVYNLLHCSGEEGVMPLYLMLCFLHTRWVVLL